MSNDKLKELLDDLIGYLTLIDKEHDKEYHLKDVPNATKIKKNYKGSYGHFMNIFSSLWAEDLEKNGYSSGGEFISGVCAGSLKRRLKNAKIIKSLIEQPQTDTDVGKWQVGDLLRNKKLLYVKFQCHNNKNSFYALIANRDGGCKKYFYKNFTNIDANLRAKDKKIAILENIILGNQAEIAELEKKIAEKKDPWCYDLDKAPRAWMPIPEPKI